MPLNRDAFDFRRRRSSELAAIEGKERVTMLKALAGLLFLLLVGTEYSEEFRTDDPLNAFV